MGVLGLFESFTPWRESSRMSDDAKFILGFG